MIKKFLISVTVSILMISNSFGAGSSDSGSSKTKTQYDMAVSHIKAAKKFEDKDLVRISTLISDFNGVQPSKSFYLLQKSVSKN